MRKVTAEITRRDHKGDRVRVEVKIDEVETIDEAIEVLGRLEVLRYMRYAHRLHQLSKHYQRS